MAVGRTPSQNHRAVPYRRPSQQSKSKNKENQQTRRVAATPRPSFTPRNGSAAHSSDQRSSSTRDSEMSSSDLRPSSTCDLDLGEHDDEEESDGEGQGQNDSDAQDSPDEDLVKTQCGWGRIICRLFDPYLTVKALVRMAFIDEADVDDDDYDTKKLLETYALVCRHLPGFSDSCNLLEGFERKHLIQNLRTGHSRARSEDTNLLVGPDKWYILRIINDEIPEANFEVFKTQKEVLGFNNAITGALLCPYQWDWNDTKVQEELRAETQIPSSTNFPSFFYEGNSAADPGDPFTGFLKSSILVKVFKCLFIGRESWSSQSAKKGTKRNKLESLGLTRVKPALIAYTATLAYQAMSSASQHIKNSDSFCLQAMYQALMEFLTDKTFQEEVDDILDWWNRAVIPNGIRARKAAAVAPDQTDTVSYMRQLKVQRALANRTNVGANGEAGGFGGVAGES